MEEIKLAVQKRQGGQKKGELSETRLKANVPGVVYGANKPPIPVVFSEKELLGVRKAGGANAIIHLDFGGKAAETVIIKSIQRHPVTSRLIHADFQRISLSQKIEAKVPLRILGEAPGAKMGGVLEHVLRVLAVKALPTDIPQHFDVDVTKLEMNDHLLVKDLTIPAKIEVLDSPEHIVVHVTQAKVEEAETPAAAVDAAAATAAEPELSTTKGKKDEEGKLLPKDAKAAAAPAPEKGKEAGKK